MLKKILTAQITLVALGLTLAGATQAAVVVDTNGKPVAGVTVHAVVMDCTTEKARLDGQTTSGSDGTFSFPLLGKAGSREARTFVAYKPGEYLGWLFDIEGMAKDTLPRFFKIASDLVLRPLKSVSGNVVDAAGEPMAGVRVSVSGYWFESEPFSSACAETLEPVGAAPAAVTDAKGAYELKDVISGGKAAVEASKTGYAMQSTPENAGAGGKAIVMVPEGRMGGRVVDAAGKPLASMKVNWSTRAAFRMPAESAVTGADGSFVIPGLSPGEYEVTASSADGFAPSEGKVQVTSGKTADAGRMVFRPFVTLSGKVISPNAAVSLEGISVFTWPTTVHFRMNAEPTKVGADGSLTLKTLPGENYINCSNLPLGYWVANDFRTVTVPETGMGNMEIKLVKGDVAKGRVVDVEGKPVAGASVSGDYGTDDSTTDAEGWFALTVPPAAARSRYYSCMETEIAISVKDPVGKRAAKLNLERDALIEGTAVITVRPTRSFTVHVKSASGKPIPGAKVYLTERQSPNSSSTGEPEVADASGKFTFTDLIEGMNYGFSALAQGYYDRGERKPVTIGAAGAPSEMTIPMDRATRVQTGKVLDEKGNPVANVEVSVDMDHGPSASTTKTDTKGCFTIESLPDSPVTLSVFADNSYGNITVSKYTGPVVIQLKRSRDSWPSE